MIIIVYGAKVQYSASLKLQVLLRGGDVTAWSRAVPQME